MLHDDEHTLHNKVYGPTYVPYKEDGQHILLPQMTDYVTKRQSQDAFQFTPTRVM